MRVYNFPISLVRPPSQRPSRSSPTRLWFSPLVLVALCAVRADEPRLPRFETEIRRILKTHCWQCHGEASELKGGLDARLVRFLLKGGDSGAAIVAGKHAESLLYQRVAAGEMPPGEKKLSPLDLEILARWIDGGARTVRPEPETLGATDMFTEEERQHWSFQPIRRATLSSVKGLDRVRSPIDVFLLSRLESHGFGFGPEADRQTLIRRLYFDLVGLPPSPDAMDRFTTDDAPDAWDRLVDERLADPAYGERWARHWLDVAGYADSNGYTGQDTVRSWAYRYRDYVIRALNADRPWNEFLVEQLGGDELLTPPYEDLTSEQADQLMATGFLRLGPDGTGSPEVDQNVARNQVIAEVIKVVTTSLLGMSVGCAQCHHHRYDPITHADYYRVRALFEPAYDWKNWRSPGDRLVSLWSSEVRQRAIAIFEELEAIPGKREAELDAAVEKFFARRLAELPAEIQAQARAARQTPEKERTDAQQQLIKEHPFLRIDRGTLGQFDRETALDIVEKWKKLEETTRKKLPANDKVMCLTELPGKVSPTRLFARGDFNQPREEVAPGELSVLSTDDVTIPENDPRLPSTGRRLAYARHLTSGRHPLVARVLVNRFWLHHFGQGLVGTPADFGLQGERPSHPELLDWLAAEFMENGWSLKRLHRLILTSTAYRQASTRRKKLDALDPDNRWLGRMSVHRLEAETLRDALLAVSGRLSRKMYGRPVPVSFDETGQRVIVAIDRWDANGRLIRKPVPLGEDEFRRTTYVQVRRSMPLGVLAPFDPPAMRPNCALRDSSTTASQSLLMMNHPFVIRQVNDLAARIRSEAGADPHAQFRLAWRLTLGREPSSSEVRSGTKFLSEQAGTVESTSIPGPEADPNVTASDPALTALAHLCHALVSSNAFLYVD